MYVCPGALFEEESDILPIGPTKTFYVPARLENGQVHHDVEEVICTIEKMQEYDGQDAENVFVVVAHDETLFGCGGVFEEKGE